MGASVCFLGNGTNPYSRIACVRIAHDRHVRHATVKEFFYWPNLYDRNCAFPLYISAFPLSTLQFCVSGLPFMQCDEFATRNFIPF